MAQKKKQISVHDNRIISYTVFCNEQKVHLETKFDEKKNSIEHTNIKFIGVEGYKFEGDNFSNIIFDVSEVGASKIYEDNTKLFEEGVKYAWPGNWNTSEQGALKYLKENDIKGFILSSSDGMAGWVLAKKMKIVSKTTKK